MSQSIEQIVVSDEQPPDLSADPGIDPKVWLDLSTGHLYTWRGGSWVDAEEVVTDGAGSPSMGAVEGSGYYDVAGDQWYVVAGSRDTGWEWEATTLLTGSNPPVADQGAAWRIYHDTDADAYYLWRPGLWDYGQGSLTPNGDGHVYRRGELHLESSYHGTPPMRLDLGGYGAFAALEVGEHTAWSAAWDEDEERVRFGVLGADWVPQCTYAADPTDLPTALAVIAELRDALVAFGIMAPGP